MTRDQVTLTGNERLEKSPVLRPARAGRAPAQRSAAGNDPRHLAGADGNSVAGRRFRDIVASLIAELGGDLSESERLQVRAVAGMVLHSDALTAAVARGEAVDPESFTRATNGALRAIAGLKRSRAPQGRGRRQPLAHGGPHPLAVRQTP